MQNTQTAANPNAETRPLNLAAIQKVAEQKREEIARFAFRCGYQSFLAKK